MSKIDIRPAEISDASKIHEFIVELAIFEKAEHEVKSNISDIEKSLFADGSTAHALIGEKDGTAVGMAVYFFNYSTWLGKNGVYLEDLYVSVEQRGLGIGKLLLSHLAALAVENKCERLEWSVLDWNKPAIDVYDAIGAVPQDEWIGYRLSGKALNELASFSTAE